MAKHSSTPARIRRLTEELAEVDFFLDGPSSWQDAVLAELHYALRPAVHERRVPTFGAIIGPTTDPSSWSAETQLEINHRPVDEMNLASACRFADGLSSWMLRRVDGPNEIAVFDRPTASERDLVVLAEALGATVVQRHPSGSIRLVGSFGVLRSEGLEWHHEPPISRWIETLTSSPEHGDREVVETIVEFAVHDLGSRGIGAILVYQPEAVANPTYEIRLGTPPPLEIMRASDLAPLRHVLGQVDGAAILDSTGTLRQLGVRLVPSAEAEADIAGYRGMRHTSGRRYSFDDTTATVIVVSEDGPVTVLRKGELLGTSVRPTRVQLQAPHVLSRV
ncbi:MAG: diadenylate cyclase [Ilumatobacteraceae bacterium]